MSSEESVTTSSSRLRQFGLYRTIDTRTEEFLKLSRRRQIRQGCACAAVSTAITVTVVVGALLVYEYGFHAEFNAQPRHRPNWLSMFNDTDSNFDKNILHRSNLNLDRSTLKLLPIIIKALKQNQYLGKATEESSSQSPNIEKYTTDFAIQKNVFTDARNWLRMPPQRMYAIEYKASPIVFFKTRNLDSYAKARKVMDSQRVMNYLDRMLNEKVSYMPTIHELNMEPQSTVKTTASTERIKNNVLHHVNANTNKEVKPYKAVDLRKEKQVVGCKCSKNLGEILRKIAKSIQQLIPENRQHQHSSDVSRPCSGSRLKINDRSKVYNVTKGTTSTMPKQITTGRYLTQRTKSKPIPLKNVYLKPRLKLRPKSKMLNLPGMVKQRSIPKKATNKYENLPYIAQPNRKQTYASKENYDSKKVELTTTMKAYLEPTEYLTDEKATTTQPLKRYMKTKRVPHSTTVDKMTVNRSYTMKAYERDHSSTDTESSANDITTETVLKSTTNFYHLSKDHNLTVNDMLLKNYVIKYRNSQKNNNHKFETDKFSDLERRFSEFPMMNAYNVTRIIPGEVEDSQKSESSTMATVTTKHNIIKNLDNIPKIESPNIGSSNTRADDYIESVIPELIDTYTTQETTVISNLDPKINSGSREYRESRSMIPKSRPQFLEIRRSDGRQEVRHEVKDYDLDVNWNNYLDD